MPTTLSAQQAADKLQVDKSTIYKMARSGELKHFHVGKRVLFTEERIDEWIREQEEASINQDQAI